MAKLSKKAKIIKEKVSRTKRILLLKRSNC